MTNKEIIKAWFDAMDAKNFSSIKNFMDRNYRFQNPMTPAPMGNDEHLGMMQAMTAAFAGSHELNIVISEEDYVAVSGKWSAKQIGEFNGIPSSGKSVVLSFVSLFEFIDGKVVKQHMEFNPMSMMAQLGAAPVNA